MEQERSGDGPPKTTDTLRNARTSTALAILASLTHGEVSTEPFTEDGSWWSNFGISWPIAEFNTLLSTLHAQTSGGLHVTPTRIIADGNVLLIEADAHAELTNGRAYANRCAFIIEFRGDRVLQIKEYNDTYHVAEVFGLKP